MSYSSMTLKNVMGGCQLIDLKPPVSEKSFLIDLSLIGVNLHELQKNLICNNMSPGQHNVKVESVNTAVTESEFRGESRKVKAKDNNNNFSVQPSDYKLIKSNAQTALVDAQSNLELFDFNANKVVQAQPNDNLQPPVFTSIQNFYETFDVSDQIESMSDIENIVHTPSPASTLDSSSYEQDTVICEPSTVYRPNLKVIPATATSTRSEDQCELYFIPNAVIPQVSTQPLLAPKITKQPMQNVHKSYDSLEPQEQKRKPVERSSRKKPGVEKSIGCSRCSKKFRTAAHLKVHFMIHVDSECVHRCTVCERRFCHRGALTLHARKHAPKPIMQSAFL